MSEETVNLESVSEIEDVETTENSNIKTDNISTENPEEDFDSILESALEEKRKEKENKNTSDIFPKKRRTQGQDASSQKWQDIDNIIKNANDDVLIKTLSPEVIKNEELKRTHKSLLLKYVSIFLGIQFVVIFVLTMTMVVSIIVFHALENDFSDKLVQMLFAFFGTYITSVIVELICILHYIVQNVFDTSIAKLMKIFGSSRDGDNEKQKSEKQKSSSQK